MTKSFLESVQVTIDGPKLPFHVDYKRIDDETFWYVTDDNNPTRFIGPFMTARGCGIQRDNLNKEFRDSGQSKAVT